MHFCQKPRFLAKVHFGTPELPARLFTNALVIFSTVFLSNGNLWFLVSGGGGRARLPSLARQGGGLLDGVLGAARLPLAALPPSLPPSIPPSLLPSLSHSRGSGGGDGRGRREG